MILPQNDEAVDKEIPTVVIAQYQQQTPTSAALNQSSSNDQSKKIINLEVGRNGTKGPVTAFEINNPYLKETSQISSMQSMPHGSQDNIRGLSNTLTIQCRQKQMNPRNPNAYASSHAVYQQSQKLQRCRPLTFARRGSDNGQNQTVIKRPKSASQQQQRHEMPVPSSQIFPQGSIQNIIHQQSPGKLNNNYNRNKQFSKIMPTSPKQSKEDLYAAALQSKVEANKLREENIRLQTRITFIESKLGSSDHSGHINMLLQQLKNLKQKYQLVLHEYKAQQSLMKSTQINETKAEIELYKLELIRLRNLLESELNNKIQDAVKQCESPDVRTPKQDQGQERRLHILRKANTDQSKRIINLTEKLANVEQVHQAKIQALSHRLEEDLEKAKISIKAEQESRFMPIIEQLEDDLAQQRQQNQILESQNEELVQQVAETTQQLQLLQDNSQHEQEITNLKLEHQQEVRILCENQAKELEEMRDNYSSEIEEMLDTHAQELEDKNNSLKHLVGEHERLIEEEKNLKAQAVRLQQDMVQERKNLEIKINHFQTEFEQQQGSIILLKAEISDANNQKINLENELRNQSASKATLMREHQELNQSLTDLKNRLNQLEKINKTLRLQCQDLQYQLEEKMNQVQAAPPKPEFQLTKKLTTQQDETFDRDDTISCAQRSEKSDHSNNQVEDDLPFVKKDVLPKLDFVSDSQNGLNPKLKTALSNLTAAAEAVQTLEHKFIQEIAQFNRPPQDISFAMDAVMILLQKPLGWASVRRELHDPNFIKQVLEVEKDKIPEQNLKILSQFTKHAKFTAEQLMFQSTGAAVLCIWVKAVEEYAKCILNSTKKLDQQLRDSIQSNITASAIPQAEIQLQETVKKVEFQRQESILTPQHEEIKNCLYSLKRKCQLNYIQFDQIENFIFGDEYRPELRITQSELSMKVQDRLRIPNDQADLFSKYLVDQGQQSRATGQQILPQSKVLQCRVITTLIQNLNMYCQGVQIFSRKKELKMKLIIGDTLQNKNIHFTKWDQFELVMKGMKIEKETLDCAFIYCLRMSGEQEEVSGQIVSQFIEECKKELLSHSMTGRGIPIQTELLDNSISAHEEEDYEEEEINDRQAETMNSVKPTNKQQVSEPFDSGRDYSENEAYEEQEYPESHEHDQPDNQILSPNSEEQVQAQISDDGGYLDRDEDYDQAEIDADREAELRNSQIIQKLPSDLHDENYSEEEYAYDQEEEEEVNQNEHHSISREQTSKTDRNRIEGAVSSSVIKGSVKSYTSDYLTEQRLHEYKIDNAGVLNIENSVQQY